MSKERYYNGQRLYQYKKDDFSILVLISNKVFFSKILSLQQRESDN